MTTPLPAARRRIGWRVLSFDRLDSTNTHGLTLAGDAKNHGVVIVAGAQTAGRGQHGRSWLATPGSSVLMSALVFPPPELRQPARLTAWAAVAVCDLIRQVIGKHGRIKWPNDVLINQRKVCGILIEQRTVGPHVATVAGIGLNVSQDAQSFAAVNLPDAGSLAMFADRVPDAAAVAQMLLPCLDRTYQELEAGDSAALEQRWRHHLDLTGRQVIVEGTRATYRGTIQDIGFDEFRLELPGGESLRLAPEEIRHIHQDP
ncbi:MAG: biotin--[acetyl-CoA-carboxylase] ligase [Planctomycetes bacterium]|nr:biotin--[acetyl-CoA-carboxylase] ligase [Planctomycetota bacterium]